MNAGSVANSSSSFSFLFFFFFFITVRSAALRCVKSSTVDEIDYLSVLSARLAASERVYQELDEVCA